MGYSGPFRGKCVLESGSWGAIEITNGPVFLNDNGQYANIPRLVLRAYCHQYGARVGRFGNGGFSSVADYLQQKGDGAKLPFTPQNPRLYRRADTGVRGCK